MSDRLSHREMADRMAALVWVKKTWIEQHGSKRPEFEVMQRRQELEALEQAATDYRRASERKDAAA